MVISMIEGRLEAHEIAEQLWEEHNGIRARIKEILVGDKVTEEQEILAAVCMHYLMRIFGPESPLDRIEFQGLEVRLGSGDLHSHWPAVIKSDPAISVPFLQFDSMQGLPLPADEAYESHLGISVYVACLLQTHAMEYGMATDTQTPGAKKVWQRLVELGLAEELPLQNFWAKSEFLHFLPHDAYDQFQDIAREFSVPQ